MRDPNGPLHTTSDGTGEPVVFLHGYPLNLAMWEPQVKTLSRSCRMVRVDLPGFGDSIGSAPPTTQQGFAESVRATIVGLGLARVSLVGHSFGGYIALQLVRDHPELVERLVLVSTRAGADSPESRLKRLATVARLESPSEHLDLQATSDALLSPATAAGGPVLEAVRRMVEAAPNPAVIAALLAIANRPDLTPSLAQIRIPTLVLWGEQDRLIPPGETKGLASGIRSAEGEGIPGAGHLSPMEAPERFDQAVVRFLA